MQQRENTKTEDLITQKWILTTQKTKTEGLTTQKQLQNKNTEDLTTTNGV